MTQWWQIAPVDGWFENTWKIVSLNNIEIVVINMDGFFFALEDRCAHDGSPLAGEPLEENSIVCPRHGARFCVKTGRVLEGPAYEDLQIFATRVIDGIVWVEA